MKKETPAAKKEAPKAVEEDSDDDEVRMCLFVLLISFFMLYFC